MRWSDKDLIAYEKRRNCSPEHSSSVEVCQTFEPDEGKESELQAKIQRWLTAHGYPWHSDRSRGKNKPGWPDITACLPRGRVAFLELKAAKGRLTEEQRQVRLMMQCLGHEFHEVRSFSQFLEIVQEVPEELSESTNREGELL